MDVPPTLAEQLHVLTAGLGRLGREVVAVVPSCVAVSIAARRLGVDVVITVPAGGTGRVHRAREVFASLALPFPPAGFGLVLVLQASEPRAFERLADNLAALRGSGQPPPVLDAHLGALSSSWDGVADSFADLRLLDRAIGVLIDQGRPPEAAEAELHRRAADAGLTVAAAAHVLLTSPTLPARSSVD